MGEGFSTLIVAFFGVYIRDTPEGDNLAHAVIFCCVAVVDFSKEGKRKLRENFPVLCNFVIDPGECVKR